MTLRTDLEAYVAEVHRTAWETRDGRKVPETTDIGLGNVAVKLKGTVLYADLAESTDMVRGNVDYFSAEIYKNYLYAAAKIINLYGGTITAYDGDRIMAVFLGNSPNSDAAKCGLKINWAARNILQPAIQKVYTGTSFVLKQKVGIDTSDLFIARTGVRGNNDLVWVGNAANRAAKMAALPPTYATYISEDSYKLLLDSSKYGGVPQQDMWTRLSLTGFSYPIYGSDWTWEL